MLFSLYESWIARSWWFIGNCSAHSLAEMFWTGRVLTRRHTGQSNDIFLWFITQSDNDESINDCIHNSQNVCRQGRYFGFLNFSKQIGQSKTLPLLPNEAISTPPTYSDQSYYCRLVLVLFVRMPFCCKLGIIFHAASLQQISLTLIFWIIHSWKFVISM